MISSLGRQVHCIGPFRYRPRNHYFSSFCCLQKNPNSVATNTLVEPTEALKTVINDIIEEINFLTDTMTYKTETVLLQLE